MNIVAFKSSKSGVGKLISSSKIKYEWNLRIRNEIFNIDLLFSKMSKTHRILINDNLIWEEKVPKSYFYFKIVIEDIIFEICKNQKGEYELLINGQNYEKLAISTSGNLPITSNRELLQNTQKPTRFRIEKVDNYFRLSRQSFNSNTSLENGDNTAISNGNINNTFSSQKSFRAVDDSGEFYKHDFYYLYTKETNEDRDIINYVNNVR